MMTNSVCTNLPISPESTRLGTCAVPMMSKLPSIARMTTVSARWKAMTPKSAAPVVVFLLGAVAPMDGRQGVSVSMQKQG